MPAARLSLRAGGRFHGPAAGCAWGGGGGCVVPGGAGAGVGAAGGSGGDGAADRDPGGCCLGWQAGAAGREARAGLGFAVAVPVAVYLDAAAGQGGEGVIAVRAGQRGGEAGGSRAGPGGGDDGAAGGGERDLAGVDGLAGAGSLAGGDGD